MPGRLLSIPLAVFLLGNASDTKTDASKPKKPTLNLRVTPRMAFSPVTVYLIAELAGGDDVEAYYCPEVEWSWGDGGKSVQEADCPPYQDGVSKIDRRFTAEHDYQHAGTYIIAVTLRRVNKSLARADVRITIRPGIGDPR
jgi:hypothetical protein